MLHKVRSDQARPGMFVHELGGSWLDHPFLRSRFLLTPRKLQMLLDSDIETVVIDDERGIGPPSPPVSAVPSAPESSPEPVTAPAAQETPPAPQHHNGPHRAVPLSLEPASMAEERKRAVKIVARSKAAIMRTFHDIRLGNLVQVSQLTPLVDEIAASIARNPFALTSVTQLKERHEYTYLHSVAVCALMISLGRRLKLDESLIPDLGLAGLLHDMGKAAIPQHLLDKPGALTEAEFAVVRSHAERGHAMLLTCGGVPEIALDVCRHHHEQVGGAGYPDRLGGAALSIPARMGAICDVYDAVTSARPYKEPWSPGEALRWMQNSVRHFDQDMLEAFAGCIGIYPIGGLVRLRSDRLAVVLDSNAADPMSPPVRVFFCAIERRWLTPEHCPPGRDEIIGIERPERWGFDDWAGLRAEMMAA
ncbi:MAG: phosphodiesterase [Sphingomonas bacterium]|uniref:HD-GYP domain-containing protein n=1 Tax=Sphingomonas bacterium TaxID=1895847 RepID=UPI0026364B6A|nr:HD-GYP domain-containing protein [Sphingomonas bacterium]MDB5706122.1 phosphodiesterase [Sphingomonas bacterium]